MSIDIHTQEQVLTDEQVRTILVAMAEAKPFAIAEATQVIKWAEDTVINYAVLNNILDGHLAVSVRDDGELLFSLTEKGLAYMKSATDEEDRQTVPEM